MCYKFSDKNEQKMTIQASFLIIKISLVKITAFIKLHFKVLQDFKDEFKKNNLFKYMKPKIQSAFLTIGIYNMTASYISNLSNLCYFKNFYFLEVKTIFSH